LLGREKDAEAAEKRWMSHATFGDRGSNEQSVCRIAKSLWMGGTPKKRENDEQKGASLNLYGNRIEWMDGN
jgi:hypothetical protein